MIHPQSTSHYPRIPIHNTQPHKILCEPRPPIHPFETSLSREMGVHLPRLRRSDSTSPILVSQYCECTEQTHHPGHTGKLPSTLQCINSPCALIHTQNTVLNHKHYKIYLEASCGCSQISVDQWVRNNNPSLV